MKEKVLDILSDIKEDVDFSASTSLVQDRILTSIDIIMLVSELSDAFDITIPVGEIVPDNFNSVDLICRMIERLQEND